MRQQRPHPIICTLLLFNLMAAAGCGRSAGSHAAREKSVASVTGYVWTKVTDHAPFPEAYNFPLFNIRNTLWAFSGEGNWYSPDGQTWTKAELPPLGLRTGYQQYVQFGEAIYALGTMEGNYENLKLGSRIARTSDLKKWETIAEQSELPPRVFYGAVVFAGKIWMLGGFDGQNYYDDVWSSSDGVKWRRVTSKTSWSPRSNPSVFVFQNKLWLLGGGIIDGQIFNDVWSTTDGIDWQRATDKLSERPIFGGSTVVFDGKIWIVGLNRNDGFQNAVMVSLDGVNWIEERAPWTPRGGVATCVLNDKLFMTGGKYSITENGTIKFIYSNDVWYLAKQSMLRPEGPSRNSLVRRLRFSRSPPARPDDRNCDQRPAAPRAAKSDQSRAES